MEERAYIPRIRTSLSLIHILERGEIPIYAQENVQAMYEAYHELGGNGTVTKLVREIMALPTRKG